MTHEQKQIMDRLASFSGVSSSLYLTNLAVEHIEQKVNEHSILNSVFEGVDTDQHA
jgi:hypothetical protein